AEPKDYNFVNYLKEVKNLKSQDFLNGKESYENYHKESKEKCNNFD
ncbi:5016_t:CDS:1, partial [Entrophospora sp. SA101]